MRAGFAQMLHGSTSVIVKQVEQKILSAQCLAESALTPVALLLTRELMWEDA